MIAGVYVFVDGYTHRLSQYIKHRHRDAAPFGETEPYGSRGIKRIRKVLFEAVFIGNKIRRAGNACGNRRTSERNRDIRIMRSDIR